MRIASCNEAGIPRSDLHEILDLLIQNPDQVDKLWLLG
jgi:hypothetical protein